MELRLINCKLAAARMRVNALNKNRAALAELSQRLSAVEQMEEVAESKLRDLREASDESWEAARSEVESYWESLAKEVAACDPGD